jgi:hypothetical protein
MAMQRLDRALGMPSLEALVADPGRIAELPRPIVVELRRRCGHLLVDLDAALARATPPGEPLALAPDQWVGLRTLSRFTGLSPKSLRAAAHAGDLPARQARAGKWLVQVGAASQWLAGRGRPAPGSPTDPDEAVVTREAARIAEAMAARLGKR